MKVILVYKDESYIGIYRIDGEDADESAKQLKKEVENKLGEIGKSLSINGQFENWIWVIDFDTLQLIEWEKINDGELATKTIELINNLFENLKDLKL